MPDLDGVDAARRRRPGRDKENFMPTHLARRALGSRHMLSVLLVTVLAASVAVSATTAAAAGREKPVVTAITVHPIHSAGVVRGDDGKDHVEYDLLVVSVVGDPVTLSSVT